MSLNETAADLPRDIELLQQMVRQRDEQLARQSAEAVLLQAFIDKLKLQIARLKRQRFGASSERQTGELAQLELLLEELQTNQAENTARDELTTGKPPERRRPVRKPLPDHLPREPQIHTCDGGCPACGGADLIEIGQDVCEQLELVPQRFKVIRHIRPKYKCRACQSITQQPAPARPIAKGLAGPGLLAHVLVAKYQDHLPLYRQSEMYGRHQVDLPRSTLADWVGECAALLAPLTQVLGRYVKQGAKLHADDTPIQVLRPGKGKTGTARLWAYVRDDRPMGDEAAPAVWLQYSPDRKGEHVHRHLADFEGVLQADGYAGYGALYETSRISEAACWAHARRKFFELNDLRPGPTCQEALARIARLYEIERSIRGQPPPDRLATRQTEAVPLLSDMKQWLERTLGELSAKSALAQTIRYSLTRWQALTRYAHDGRLEIDNNAAERAIRQVALGRKNYLFVGSDAGGERAAAIYSLLGTAKLNGIDPEGYLRQVLARIGERPINRVDKLLPWNISATTPMTADSKCAVIQRS